MKDGLRLQLLEGPEVAVSPTTKPCIREGKSISIEDGIAKGRSPMSMHVGWAKRGLHPCVEGLIVAGPCIEGELISMLGDGAAMGESLTSVYGQGVTGVKGGSCFGKSCGKGNKSA